MLEDAHAEGAELQNPELEAQEVAAAASANAPPELSTAEAPASSTTEHKEHTASGFARPRTSLKDVPQQDPATYKEAPRQRAYTAPAPNQGSYYGTQGSVNDDSHADTKLKQPSTASDGSEKRGSGPAPKLTDIANMLNRKVSLDQRKQKQEAAARLQRQQRFSISRSLAAPVERVLEVYNDPRTDLYDVLGVRRSISDAALRKAYRAKALAIHPGTHLSECMPVVLPGLHLALKCIALSRLVL
jgi:hypothetical protein